MQPGDLRNCFYIQMSFAQKCYSPDEVVHSPSKNVIKHFHTIPFNSLITMIEIEHGRNFNQLFNACSSHQDFPLMLVLKYWICLLCVLVRRHTLPFFFFHPIGKGWSCNSLGRPEAVVGLQDIACSLLK